GAGGAAAGGPAGHRRGGRLRLGGRRHGARPHGPGVRRGRLHRGAAVRSRLREPGRARRNVPGDALGGDQRSPRHRQGDEPPHHRALEARGPVARDAALRAPVPVLLALRLGAHLLPPQLVVRAHDRHQGPDACDQPSGAMRRVPEVSDAWFDSGAMPYGQWHYPFEHQADFKAHFPADFICEGVDQTRGWFYSLLAIGVAVRDSVVYKQVIVNELVLDAQGQKMSKSRGNVINPWQVIEEHGADAVRLYLLGQSQVWFPKRFDRRQIPDVAGGFLNTLRNAYTFFAQYAQDWRADGDGPSVSGRPLADRWVLAKLDEVVAVVRDAWNAYDVTAGTRAIMDFVADDLSNWYVRTNRPRFWAPDRAADEAALRTLHDVLLTTAQLVAPAAPFVSDWLHRAL